MQNTSPFRKIFHGVATGQQMFGLFRRYSDAPFDADRTHGRRDAGEWFEIGEREYDYMLDILPPRFMRGGMFAMSEFLAGSVTSLFLAIGIDSKSRWFHGYRDLSDKGSPDRLRAAIIERESRSVGAMSRQEKIEHIWSTTPVDDRGYAGKGWPQALQGKRTILACNGNHVTDLKLLDHLTDDEIAAKLPTELRRLPDPLLA
jgi:hypothetical protein